MKIMFTSKGMSINGGDIDPRFVLAEETCKAPRNFIKSNPEDVTELIEIIKPVLSNRFKYSYWNRHVHFVPDGGKDARVAYCDGIYFGLVWTSMRSETPQHKDFPVSETRIVRVTLKAFDGDTCHGESFLSLEEIDVPEYVISYQKEDGSWTNPCT